MSKPIWFPCWVCPTALPVPNLILGIRVKLAFRYVYPQGPNREILQGFMDHLTFEVTPVAIRPNLRTGLLNGFGENTYGEMK